MNAKEARELTNNALKNNGGIEKFLKTILEKIEIEARKGENVLRDPLSHEMSYEQQKQVIKVMKEKGYKYTYSKGNYHDYDPAFFSW